MNKIMKSSTNHVIMAGMLALLSFMSCTDDVIETPGTLQGVDRNRQVEVTLPFGVGRGISTTITTRAADKGEVNYDSQLSGVMAFVYEAKVRIRKKTNCSPTICSPIRPTSFWMELPADGWKTTTTQLVAPSSSISRWAMCTSTCWVMRKVRSSISSRV